MQQGVQDASGKGLAAVGLASTAQGRDVRLSSRRCHGGLVRPVRDTRPVCSAALTMCAGGQWHAGNTLSDIDTLSDIATLMLT